MASRKKALDSALGAMLTGKPAAPETGTAADGGTVAPGGKAAPAADVAPGGVRGDDDTAGELDAGGEAAGYARTSTGYRRGDGETVRRVSLMLTDRQRRDLRRLAAGSPNVSEYVVEALGLGHPNPGPRC